MSHAPLHIPLADRALLRLSGPDWRSFLQGLITQDVETLAPGELRYGALLSPQGRLLLDLFVLGEADGCLIDAPADRLEDLIRRLTLYRLRAKVDIAPASGQAAVLIGASGTPAGWLDDPRLPGLALRGYGTAAPAGTVAGEISDWDAHRIALAVPAMADFGDDASYPIEVNLDLLGAIDFHKGCFVGQETTSRMKRRGQIKSRLLPLAADGPPPGPGAEILSGDLRAGVVRSGVARPDGSSLYLGLMRLDRSEGDLTVEDRPTRLQRPGWMGT